MASQPRLGTIVEAEKNLFNDLDPAEAEKWAAGLTGSPILTTKLTNDAYSAVPCAYLVLDGDLTLPKEYQEGTCMAALQGSKTGEFTMYHCPSLSPFDLDCRRGGDGVGLC